MKKYFKERHAIVAEKLKSITSVAFTSDIWSGNTKEDYLSVVAHYKKEFLLIYAAVNEYNLIDKMELYPSYAKASHTLQEHILCFLERAKMRGFNNIIALLAELSSFMEHKIFLSLASWVHYLYHNIIVEDTLEGFADASQGPNHNNNLFKQGTKERMFNSNTLTH
ncbi:hypothetical protein ACJX0J_018163 [Zea mays]